MATALYLESEKLQSKYYDKKSGLTPEEYQQKLQTTCTVYVGNLSIGTSEDSIYEFFSRAGRVKHLHMGTNSIGQPAGFCFIVYTNHEDAGNAVNYLSQLKLEDRIIRVDWDIGFDPSRQQGRGSNGLQIRDCMRQSQDKQRLNLDSRSQWIPKQGLGYNQGGRGNSYNNRYQRDNHGKYGNNGGNFYNKRNFNTGVRMYNNNNNNFQRGRGGGYHGHRGENHHNYKNQNRSYSNGGNNQSSKRDRSRSREDSYEKQQKNQQETRHYSDSD